MFTGNINIPFPIESFYVLEAIRFENGIKKICARKELSSAPTADELAQFIYENRDKADYCTEELAYREVDCSDLPFSDESDY